MAKRICGPAVTVMAGLAVGLSEAAHAAFIAALSAEAVAASHTYPASPISAYVRGIVESDAFRLSRAGALSADNDQAHQSKKGL